MTISHCECYDPKPDEWLEATNMSIIRSALTANVVRDLPNIREYLYQDRNKLLEERRQKVFRQESSDLFSVPSGLDLNDDLEVLEYGPLPINGEEMWWLKTKFEVKLEILWKQN